MLQTSIFALLGVIIGSILTFFFSRQQKKDEYKHRINEKILDKRIIAYEAILEMSKLFRTTISKQLVNENGNLVTFSGMVASKKIFEDFKARFYELENFNNHWLEPELHKYTFFVQEYIMNLDLLLKDINELYLSEVGEIIKPDFLGIANNLEKLALKFLSKGIYDFKKDYYENDSFYDNKTRTKMFLETELSKNNKVLREKYINK